MRAPPRKRRQPALRLNREAEPRVEPGSARGLRGRPSVAGPSPADRARRPGRESKRPSAAARSARTRRSGCRRADPVAADPEPARLEQPREVLADPHRAVLVERAVIAEAREIELQRLQLDDPFVGNIVDHQMREVRLAGHRADRGELGRDEADDVVGVGVRVRRAVEGLGVGRRRGFGRPGRDGRRRAWVSWPWAAQYPARGDVMQGRRARRPAWQRERAGVRGVGDWPRAARRPAPSVRNLLPVNGRAGRRVNVRLPTRRYPREREAVLRVAHQEPTRSRARSAHQSATASVSRTVSDCPDCRGAGVSFASDDARAR